MILSLVLFSRTLKLSNEYSTCLNYTTWGFREWSKREKIVKVVVIVSLLISHQLEFDLDNEAKQVLNLAF